jgi:hypothetical protein
MTQAYQRRETEGKDQNDSEKLQRKFSPRDDARMIQ